MTECIQARRTKGCQEGGVTGEEIPLKMPPCPRGLQCCRALVVFALRLYHVIWSRWGGRGGSLSRTRLGCQTSCSSNKDCHSNDHSVGLTSNPHCYKKQREGLDGIVGGPTSSNVWYLHQLDKQDGGAHQSPLGLLWLEGHGAPRGQITEPPLITSCHIDENSVRATDVLFRCCCVNLGLPGLLSTVNYLQQNDVRCCPNGPVIKSKCVFAVGTTVTSPLGLVFLGPAFMSSEFVYFVRGLLIRCKIAILLFQNALSGFKLVLPCFLFFC